MTVVPEAALVGQELPRCRPLEREHGFGHRLSSVVTRVRHARAVAPVRRCSVLDCVLHERGDKGGSDSTRLLVSHGEVDRCPLRSGLNSNVRLWPSSPAEDQVMLRPGCSDVITMVVRSV